MCTAEKGKERLLPSVKILSVWALSHLWSPECLSEVIGNCWSSWWVEFCKSSGCTNCRATLLGIMGCAIDETPVRSLTDGCRVLRMGEPVVPTTSWLGQRVCVEEGDDSAGLCLSCWHRDTQQSHPAPRS